ncbi:MAG: UDP-N-acetylmuramoyl-tripeptide--D-alanyl-D-alanine ligase, partial [Firmicutes bacterium]|nr:UDP-N-acetylmuramoyl-tripeptide--D-alanyl-D-alanine ligase [Bacillota bacterium]
MKSTDIAFLADACGGRVSGNTQLYIDNVKIDSRACGQGDLFVCIVGEKNDGHDYIMKAYDQGCRAFLVSEPVGEQEDAAYIHVEDTNLAVRLMAQAYLAQFPVIKIGVTGSVGKTTTRMLTAAVMSAKYRTVCTQKNLNTHLGLCLTCFLADDSTQCVVFEMGMDRKNELAEYVEWVRPQLAIITNVGVSHMERLGSRDAIADAKLEIVNKFTEDNILIVNTFSDYLKTEEEIRERAVNKKHFRIVSVGRDLCYKGLKNRGSDGIEFYVNGVKFELPLLGEHNALDACLAVACGKEFGITEQQAAEALSRVEANERRLKAENINGVLLMDDSYNASPDSMKAGIAALE